MDPGRGSRRTMKIGDVVRSWRATPVLEVSADPADVESMTVRYLMYVLAPLWFVPGIADWVMHRRTRIEQTSGLRESLIHLLMMAEMAVPVTLVLFCEVDAPVLALCAASGLAHEGTAIWDMRAATSNGRELEQTEEHIHSFLELLPFMAISALLCLHWDQVAGRKGWPGPPRLRARRLPGPYVAALLGGMGGLVALPYAEEALRCARHARKARKPHARKERMPRQQAQSAKTQPPLLLSCPAPAPGSAAWPRPGRARSAW